MQGSSCGGSSLRIDILRKGFSCASQPAASPDWAWISPLIFYTFELELRPRLYHSMANELWNIRGSWVEHARNESPSTSKGEPKTFFRISMENMPLVQPKTHNTCAFVVRRLVNVLLCLASVTFSSGEIISEKESPDQRLACAWRATRPLRRWSLSNKTLCLDLGRILPVIEHWISRGLLLYTRDQRKSMVTARMSPLQSRLKTAYSLHAMPKPSVTRVSASVLIKGQT